ncbi:MAG: CoA-binding protein [Nitrososphaeria archaeon]|nr:CoA-binding protein [Nitrososphaeria archaeon]
MVEKIVEELDPIFKPKTIALIGASREERKWGNIVLKNLIGRGYKGKVYLVNPNIKEIYGLKCYNSILDINDDIECAYIAIPANLAQNVLKECGEKGVKGAIIISGGFSEIGKNGEEVEKGLLVIAKRYRFRILGPNTMGVYSAAMNMNATFTSFAPKPGNIAFVSQSGYFGGQLFSAANMEDIGFSIFANVGNQCDIQVHEVIEYLFYEENTKVITLYVEGLEDGKRFIEKCSRVSKHKPIVVYKAGKSPIGARATLSHTASLAGNDKIYDVAFEKAGAIRVSESYHLFEYAHALETQHAANGNRLGIVSSSGGFCVSLSDTAYELGLEIPTIDIDTRKEIKKILMSYTSEPYNPIDTAGDLRNQIYPKIAKILLDKEYIDIVIISPTFGLIDTVEALKEETEALIEFLQLKKEYDKPIIFSLTNFLTPIVKLLKRYRFPVYRTPEQCARAAYALYMFGKSRR